MLKKKYDLYCWGCDFSENRGEGILARDYIKNLSKFKKKRIFIKSPDGDYFVENGKIKIIEINKKNLLKLNFNFFFNYFTPFLGIIYLWINYFKKNGICYLNFLPLWNIFLFIFLPPRTHLGPITGFIFKEKIKGINSFLRKYLNNFLFSISAKLIKKRQNYIYFSTDLLKPIFKNNLKNIFFNYLINLIKIKNKNKRKTIEILIYNRNYSVKNNFERNQILKVLIKNKLNIYVIGDTLLYKGLKNIGFVSRKKANYLLNKTIFVINSGENPYNIFSIDAFNNHSNIIYERKKTDKIKFFNKEKIFFLNFNDRMKICQFFKKKNINNFKESRILNETYKIKKESYFYFKNVKIFFTKKQNN